MRAERARFRNQGVLHQSCRAENGESKKKKKKKVMVYISFRFLEWVDHDYSMQGVVQQIRVIQLRCKQQILEHNKPVLRSDCYLFRSTTYPIQYIHCESEQCVVSSEQCVACTVCILKEISIL